MDELILPKPDLNKLMAVMPNFEDFEDLIIRRLDCGGRGTVGTMEMVLTSMILMMKLITLMTLMSHH